MILDSYLDIVVVCVQLPDGQDEKLFLINHEKMDAYNNLISKKQVPWPMTKRLNSLLAWSVCGRCFPLKLYNSVCVLPDSISCYQKLLAFWNCIIFLKVCLIFSLVMFPVLCMLHLLLPWRPGSRRVGDWKHCREDWNYHIDMKTKAISYLLIFVAYISILSCHKN